MLDLNRVDVVLGNRMNMNEAFKVLNFDRTRFKILLPRKNPWRFILANGFCMGSLNFWGCLTAPWQPANRKSAVKIKCGSSLNSQTYPAQFSNG